MNILLIQPGLSPDTAVSGVLEPLGLEILAATLPSHQTRILDMRFEDDLAAELAIHPPDVVGISAITASANAARRIARAVKCARPSTVVVVGGHHATVEPEFFTCPDVDAVCIGPGEDAFPAVILAVSENRTLSGIPGLAQVVGGRFIAPASPAPIRPPDEVPLPQRSLTARYRKRYWFQAWRDVALVYTTRGCPHRCTFCACWKITGGAFYSRQPEKIAAELANLPEKHIYLGDDNSFLDPERAHRLCELIRAAGIRKRYFGYIRADSVVKHRGLIAEWRQIGLDSLVTGIESFREEDLKRFSKGTGVDVNQRAIQLLQEEGITNYAHLIIMPDFVREDFDQLFRYVDREGITRPIFPVFTPLPGTQVYEEDRGHLTTDNYDLFDLGHPVVRTRLPQPQFLREVIRLYVRAYSVRRWLVSCWLRLKALLGSKTAAADPRRHRLPLYQLLRMNLGFLLFLRKYIGSARFHREAESIRPGAEIARLAGSPD